MLIHQIMFYLFLFYNRFALMKIIQIFTSDLDENLFTAQVLGLNSRKHLNHVFHFISN